MSVGKRKFASYAYPCTDGHSAAVVVSGPRRNFEHFRSDSTGSIRFLVGKKIKKYRPDPHRIRTVRMGGKNVGSTGGETGEIAVFFPSAYPAMLFIFRSGFVRLRTYNNNNNTYNTIVIKTFARPCVPV